MTLIQAWHQLRVRTEALVPKDDPNDFRLPDFTVSYEGDTFYWEHLGMLSVPSYKEAWERKRHGTRTTDFSTGYITSEDGPDGSIDAAESNGSHARRFSWKASSHG